MSHDKKQDPKPAVPATSVAAAAEAPKQEPSMADVVAATVKETITQVIPLAITSAQMAANGVALQQAQQKRGDFPKCPECRQVFSTPTGGGCQGKHVQMVVYPKNPRLAEFFPGVILNGVTYRSNHPSELVTVPAQNDIAYSIEKFEESEDNFRHGRTASHNSGTIGPGGGRTNPAYVPNWQ